MAQTIRVSVSNMERDKNNIAEDLKGMENDIRELKDAMQELASCWEGPSWNAFQNELDQSIVEMEDVFRFFEKYLKRTENAGKTYIKCETENRDSLRNVRI